MLCALAAMSSQYQQREYSWLRHKRLRSREFHIYGLSFSCLTWPHTHMRLHACRAEQACRRPVKSLLKSEASQPSTLVERSCFSTLLLVGAFFLHLPMFSNSLGLAHSRLPCRERSVRMATEKASTPMAADFQQRRYSPHPAARSQEMLRNWSPTAKTARKTVRSDQKHCSWPSSPDLSLTSNTGHWLSQLFI